MTAELVEERPSTVTGAAKEPEKKPRRQRLSRLATTPRLIAAGYLLTSFLLMIGLWVNPIGRHHADNPGDDQVLFEWVLGHTARAITHGENPLFSQLLNVPDGVNLMANTSVVAIGLVLAPITLLFGAPVTYVLAMTLGLFGTALAWCHFFKRYLKLTTAASVVAAGLCAFGPSSVAHANGHLNFTATFMVPIILIAILRLREPGNLLRKSVWLGLLLVVQIFIGEEVVFLLALFMAVFTAVYAITEWHVVKPLIPRYLKGLTIAGLVSLALLAYPLWLQFLGPQSYSGIPWPPEDFPADLASFAAFPSDSLGGRVQLPNVRLRHNVTEENTFFGLPLAALTIVLGLMFFKRHKVLRSLSITAIVFAALSLGSQIRVNGNHTGVWGPYALVRPLPLFDSTIPTRFALVVLPVVAIFVAYGLDRASRKARELRRTWYLVFAVALVPLIPLAPSTEPRTPIPEFITSGEWRDYVDEGGTMVPVPISEHISFDGQRWQEAADFEFAVPLGAFIGPDSTGDGQWSGKHLPTAKRILKTMDDGSIGNVTDADREQAAEDLRVWRAEAVVLGPEHKYQRQLRTLLTRLWGPGTKVADVLVWKVDPRTGEVG